MTLPTYMRGIDLILAAKANTDCNIPQKMQSRQVMKKRRNAGGDAWVIQEARERRGR